MIKHTSERPELLQSDSYLSTSYTPEQPINRSTEQRLVADALHPLTHKNRPENLFLIGPPGTGKTTVAKHVMGQLDDETRVTTAFINCWQYNTRSALLTEVLIQFGYPAPRKGKPVDALLEKLQEWLTKLPGALVILDEFDQLEDAAAIVYDLQQITNSADIVLGLVLISNQPPSHLQLDPRSQSRLACQIVEFHPYSEQELVAILEERVNKAFRDDAVSQTVTEKIAAEVATQSGDCREAFMQLLRAARVAEAENTTKVHVRHLNRVQSQD